MAKKIDLDDLELEDAYSKEEIQLKVQEISDKISDKISLKYKSETPIIICVLKGAFLFAADLIKNLDIKYEIDFIKISSYGKKLKSSGEIKLINDIAIDIKNRHVIIVEDIVDTGLSIKFLKTHFQALKPKSLKFATLLCKKNILGLDFNIDWIGFNIDDGFFVGYGLDYMQLYRGLPSIKKIIK